MQIEGKFLAILLKSHEIKGKTRQIWRFPVNKSKGYPFDLFSQIPLLNATL